MEWAPRGARLGTVPASLIPGEAARDLVEAVLGWQHINLTGA
jgi:hypothetical protein